MKQKGNSPIIVIALIILIISGMLVIAQSIGNDQQPSLVISTPEATSQPVTTTPETDTTGTLKPTTNGADIDEIKYTLPSSWKAEIRNDGILFLSAEGGYLGIHVNSYDGKTGRRDFYCQLTGKLWGGRGVCTDNTTFEPMQLGNISGYKAVGIDNSGGGTEYFGAKGNKFYIISSYSQPPLNWRDYMNGEPYPTPVLHEFGKTYQQVLKSLVF